MNILYLTNHLNIGGITSYVLTLAAGLKRRGHNIYVASSVGDLVSKFIEEGIEYIPIPIKTKQEVSLKVLLSMFKLQGLIDKNNIHIIHSNSRTTQVLGALLNRLKGVPHISTCHGFFKRRWLRMAFPCWGKKVIAISEQVKEHLIQDFGVDEKKIAVINNGIDIERFQVRSQKSQVQIKEELGLGDGPVVGIIARLSDVKGHIYLIEAMKTVLESMPSAQLLIVGEGKMQRELAALTGRLGIKKSVFFIPRLTNTTDALAVTDVFVMPSLKEGLGLALMEAMASGVAVVGSNIGGIKTLIRDGSSGLLVEPKDTRGIARALLNLLKDPARRLSLGKAAQEFISKNFSREKMVRETEGVYLECVNAG